MPEPAYLNKQDAQVFLKVFLKSTAQTTPIASSTRSLTLFSRALAWLRLGQLLPWLVLAASLTVTYQLWKNAHEVETQEWKSDFDYRVGEVVTRVEQRMHSYEQVLHGAHGLFTAFHDVKREQFRTYVETLGLDKHYPGIQGLSFVAVIPAAQKERHIAAVRKEGFPEYAISPAGERPVYTSTLYLEPFSGRNLRAFGFDPFSEPVRRAAMERARDFGKSAISGKIRLQQETDSNVQAGFVLYMPIYRSKMVPATVEERRATLIGWVSAPFRMDDLMLGILGDRTPNLDIEIYDGEEMSLQTLMYDDDNLRRVSSKAVGRFQSAHLIEVAGRQWNLVFNSLPSFTSGGDTDKPYLFAVWGIGTSLLLTLLTWLLLHGRARVITAAQLMHQDLIESENRYRQMFEDNASIAFLLDPDNGRIVDANAASAAFWGYSLPELRCMNINDINLAPAGKVLEVMSQVKEGTSYRHEWRHRLKSGEIRDVEVHTGPLAYQGKTLLYSILHDITDRKQAEDALRASEERWSFALEGAGDGVWDWNIQTGKVVFSKRGREMLGFTEHDVDSSMNRWETRIHPEDLSRLVDDLRAYLDGKTSSYVSEYRMRCKDGSWKWILDRGMVVSRDTDGKPLRMIGTNADITRQREREEALRLAATVFNTVDEAVLVTDPDNCIIAVNPSFSRITGYSADDVTGRNPRILSSGTQPREFYRQMWDTLLATGNWTGEIWNRRKSGELYVEWLSINLVLDDKGDIFRYVAVFSDISERKVAEERLHRLAHYDVLTDLPNRVLLNDRLQQALVNAKRNKGKMALMFLDLDKFKPVNDTLGHNIGDLLLKELAQRLQHCIRESDTVARIGGDEFVVLLPNIEEEQDAVRVADKILQTLKLPFDLAGHHLHISSSIGIAVYPDHGEDDRQLSKNADTAMYHAKKNGGFSCVLYGEMETFSS
jgi:diguanylate cyclase (GGDEF)-like protein/PAS domain S-box-containing protein